MDRTEQLKDLIQGVHGLIEVAHQLDIKSMEVMAQDYGLYQVEALLKCAYMDMHIDLKRLEHFSKS